MNEDEVVMYIIVNSDLGMSKGKIAAQVGHVVMHLVREGEELYNNRKISDITTPLGFKIQDYIIWWSGSYTKVVLKADSKTLFHIMKKYVSDVQYQRDEGRTQIEPGSLTVVGFFPMRRKDTPDEIKKLKLL